MSSDKNFCTICNDDRIYKEATTWCTECEVFFCGKCEKHHRKSRLSQNHKILSNKDYEKLPTFMKEISSQCSDHQKKFELYCSSHACPCCVLCVTAKHQKCQDMKPLWYVLKQIQSSASVQLLEKELKDLKYNLDVAIKFLKTRISKNNIEKVKAVDEIRNMRKSIDDHLNKLEENILDDLESNYSKMKSTMDSLVKQMEQRASKIQQMHTEFPKMTTFSMYIQMYICLREIEKVTSQSSKYLDDLESRHHFNEKNIEVKISAALKLILQDVKSFGDIKITTSSSTLQFKTGRKDQAQRLVPLSSGIEQIKPSILRRLTIPPKMLLAIIACVILPDGKIVIVNKKKNLLQLFSDKGIFIRNVIKCSKYSSDACFIKNDTVAIALGDTKQTALVNVQTNKIIETIQLSHFCDSVASDSQILVISMEGKSTIVNLNDMSRAILDGVGATRISVFRGNIYGTINKEDKVCCYKSTGEALWTFMDPTIVEPGGITLDKNGFVYVACEGSHNIVVLSPDGRISMTILSEVDGIKGPWAIDINKETGILILSGLDSYAESGSDRSTFSDFDDFDDVICDPYQLFFYKI